MSDETSELNGGKPKGVRPVRKRSDGAIGELRHWWQYGEHGFVVRYDYPDGSKDTIPYFRRDGDKWKPGGPKMSSPLFGLETIQNLSPDITVFVAEGEKSAAALHALELPALTSQGGCKAAGKADWLPVQGFRDIVILRDADDAGEGYGQDVANELAKLPGSRRVQVCLLPSLPDTGDICDWVKLRIPQWDEFSAIPREAGDGLLEEFLEDVGENSKTCEFVAVVAGVTGGRASENEFLPEPIPLNSGCRSDTPYPVDALGEILGGAVEALKESIQAPTALCAQSVLAAASLAAQPHGDVEIDGRTFPCSAFFLTVGESGERKSAVDRYALAPHYERQRSLFSDYECELELYHMDSEAYTKARNEAVGKTAKGYEAKRAALRNLGDPPQEPLMPVIVTDDVTVEGIQRQLADGIPSLGIFSDEAGKIVGGHAMNPENLLKSISHLSTYWDGRDTVRLRRGDGASVLHGKRVSLHYMLQPLVSSLLLKSNLIKDQGFLSRCLPAWPVSTAGTRAYKAVDLGAHPKMRAYMGRMTAILKKPFPVKNRNELQPRPLPLTSDAKQIWKGFYNSVEVELGHSGRYASVRGLGNKAAEHAARLAAVLTLVKDLRAPQIQITEMDAGITLAHFYLEEALRIQETDVVDENIRLAETLLGWLHKRDDGFVTLRQICHEGPNAIRKGDTALQILAILEMHDWVRLIGPKRWAVTPSESED